MALPSLAVPPSSMVSEATSGRARRARDQRLRHWARRCSEERAIGSAIGRHHSAPPVHAADVGIFGGEAVDLLRTIVARIDEVQSFIQGPLQCQLESLITGQLELRSGLAVLGQAEPMSITADDVDDEVGSFYGIAVVDAGVKVGASLADEKANGSAPLGNRTRPKRELRVHISDTSTAASLTDSHDDEARFVASSPGIGLRDEVSAMCGGAGGNTASPLQNNVAVGSLRSSLELGVGDCHKTAAVPCTALVGDTSALEDNNLNAHVAASGVHAVYSVDSAVRSLPSSGGYPGGFDTHDQWAESILARHRVAK